MNFNENSVLTFQEFSMKLLFNVDKLWGRGMGGLWTVNSGVSTINMSKPALANITTYCISIHVQYRYKTSAENYRGMWRAYKKYVTLPGFGQRNTRTPVLSYGMITNVISFLQANQWTERRNSLQLSQYESHALRKQKFFCMLMGRMQKFCIYQCQSSFLPETAH